MHNKTFRALYSVVLPINFTTPAPRAGRHPNFVHGGVLRPCCCIKTNSTRRLAGTRTHRSQNWVSYLFEGQHGSIRLEDGTIQQGGPRQHDRTAVPCSQPTSRHVIHGVDDHETIRHRDRTQTQTSCGEATVEFCSNTTTNPPRENTRRNTTRSKSLSTNTKTSKSMSLASTLRALTLHSRSPR